MSKLKVVEVPNIILSQTSDVVSEFDDSVKQLVTDMFDTMRVNNGIGLAAPQVGILKRLFICEYENIQLVCINPELELYGDEVESEEGCLSIPNILATVNRYDCVKVTAYDINGNVFSKSFSGMMAIIIQHENDHLDGVLINQKAIRTRYDNGENDGKE